jgi:hypothetical protein
MTPYALEALVEYTNLTGDDRWRQTIQGIYQYFENDVQVLCETKDFLVTSYSHLRDRQVINAASYVLYSYSLFYRTLENTETEYLLIKISKLYDYVCRNQNNDGSWFYSPGPSSFIDCFHSCFIIKNLIKAAQHVPLEGCQRHVVAGYKFLKDNMYVSKHGLFTRFAKTNKPGLIRFDLYDNAEMLNLAMMMNDLELARNLDTNIRAQFVNGLDIYSQIDWLGIRRGPNFLRWAVMPYIYSLAVLESAAPVSQVPLVSAHVNQHD